MPLFQQLLEKLSGGAGARAPAEMAKGQSRLARVARKSRQAPERLPVEIVLEALEEECAQPLYDRSVYSSIPPEPAKA